MPNSYSRQQTKMFVDRGCEVFKAGKREKELEREKAMHEMGTKWGQDVLRSRRFKHFVMFWHRMISNAAGAVRRQERLQKEQAKTGDANQNKPTHMDHHGSTCQLVSHCRVEWEFSIFSWPTPRAMSSSGEFAEGSGGQTSPTSIRNFNRLIMVLHWIISSQDTLEVMMLAHTILHLQCPPWFQIRVKKKYANSDTA